MATRTDVMSIANGENVAVKVNPKQQLMKSRLMQRPALGDIANMDDKVLKKKTYVLPTNQTRNESNSEVQTQSTAQAEASLKSMTTAFSTQMITVGDVDCEDAGNPQLVSLYVNEIYDYLRVLEKKVCVKPDFLRGQGITGRMRGILIDWLVQVNARFNLLQETFYLTVDIVDRFLQAQVVDRAELQLVGITAMYVAAKYEEIYPPLLDNFVYITDDAYTPTEVRRMEINILKTIDFNLGRPLPLHFLRRNSKVGEVDAVTYNMAKYFMELAVMEYEMAHCAPSLLAAAALCLSMQVLYKLPWNCKLVHYSKYEETELQPVMGKLVDIILKSSSRKLQAIRKKYESSKFMKVSRRPELNSDKMKLLAFTAGSFHCCA